MGGSFTAIACDVEHASITHSKTLSGQLARCRCLLTAGRTYVSSFLPGRRRGGNFDLLSDIVYTLVVVFMLDTCSSDVGCIFYAFIFLPFIPVFVDT